MLHLFCTLAYRIHVALHPHPPRLLSRPLRFLDSNFQLWKCEYLCVFCSWYWIFFLLAIMIIYRVQNGKYFLRALYSPSPTVSVRSPDSHVKHSYSNTGMRWDPPGVHAICKYPLDNHLQMHGMSRWAGSLSNKDERQLMGLVNHNISPAKCSIQVF